MDAVVIVFVGEALVWPTSKTSVNHHQLLVLVVRTRRMLKMRLLRLMIRTNNSSICQGLLELVTVDTFLLIKMLGGDHFPFKEVY